MQQTKSTQNVKPSGDIDDLHCNVVTTRVSYQIPHKGRTDQKQLSLPHYQAQWGELTDLYPRA